MSYRTKFKKDLDLLKQKNKRKKTLDCYCDDDAVREIIEAYENDDPEFLAEMDELERLILASDKPLMPWDLEE